MGWLLGTYQTASGQAHSATSRRDITLSTLFDLPVLITMHKANASVITNGEFDADIDAPLIIDGTYSERLRQLPVLGSNPFATSAGLVADDVTPLIFRIRLPDGTAINSDTEYEVSVEKVPTLYTSADGPDLNKRLRVWRDNAFHDGNKIVLGPEKRDSFVYIKYVKNVEITNTDKASELPGNKRAFYKLVVRRNNFGRLNALPAWKEFSVRKPPVVLVHGYNSDRSTWDLSFRSVISDDRGYDGVIAVNYGQQNEEHVYSDFVTLARRLDEVLVSIFERGSSDWDSDAWAMTRYDVVGHSQGGVLLRLLCSEQGPSYLDKKIWQFRSPANHYRGRFRRVITIGSPHFGSSIAHLAIAIKEKELNFEKELQDKLDGFLTQWLGITAEKLLQSKFRITEHPLQHSTPLNPSARDLQKMFIPDSYARIHFLGTTIFFGQYYGGIEDIPTIYRGLYLHQNSSWGQSIAPDGSDGIVDVRSQLAGEVPNSSLINTANRISHCIPKDVFDSSDTQTASPIVGNRVLELLNGPVSAFGSFPSFEQSQALRAAMDQAAGKIETIVSTLYNQALVCRVNLFEYASLSQSKPYAFLNTPDVTGLLSYTNQQIPLILQALPDEPPVGPATWSVVVYGPDGLSTQGVFTTVSGAMNQNLLIDVSDSVIGEVVVSVRYPASNDVTVVGSPGVVLSRPPGLMTGIAVVPDDIMLSPGPTVPAQILGLYDSGTNIFLFTDTNNTTFTSSDTNTAIVSPQGYITLMEPGTATVRAVYSGIHTGSISVHVLAPLPVITSPTSAVAHIGVPFSYQITASNAPVSFTTEGLPPGLALAAGTGVITGAPLTEGLFYFSAGALNAEGQEGRQRITLTVTGSNQPPIDIALGAAAAPAMTPPGTLVGTLSTIDPNPLDTHNYALVGGTGATNNNLFVIQGNQLLTAVPIDPTTVPVCHFRVRSTDGPGISVEKTFSVPVLGAPRITRQPQDVDTFSGREFALDVRTDGYGILEYQWYSNGAVLTGEIQRVLSQSAGPPGTQTYHVVVSNSFGSETSQVATVVIAPLSFGAWSAPYAGSTTNIVVPEGDVNDDGIANWFDFVFGTKPDETANALPFLRRTPKGPALVHRRALNVMPLTYQYWTSPDLAAWESFVPDSLSVTSAPINTTSEELEVLLPIEDRLMLKMEVTP